MTKAEKQYADIIRLSRPEPEEILRRYPRQPLSERAKIFSPFAALRGHEERLVDEDDRLLLVEQAELSDENQRVLSEKIAGLQKGMEVTVTYFESGDEEQGLGRYQVVSGTVLETDPVLGRLRIRQEGEKAGEKQFLFASLAGLEIL